MDCNPVETNWNRMVSGKANFLVWISRLGNYNLARIGVNLTASLCPLYHNCNETELHLFFYCTFVKEIKAHLSLWWRDIPVMVGSIDLMVVAGSRANHKVQRGCRGCALCSSFDRVTLSQLECIQ